ncbi:MAG: hypothetical protein KME59_10930, partial [Trichormus sp. ATA11-4-KO1]|nr:hypothetical protein [Trichormus sp. ATA11-4-KO1]
LSKNSPATVNMRNFVNCGYFNFFNVKKNNPSLYQKIFMQEFYQSSATEPSILGELLSLAWI